MIAEAGKLISVYYDLISMDHHKSKDCFFSIETVLQPNEKTVFRAFHGGYHNEIGEHGWGKDRDTYRDAVNDLVTALQGFIRGEHDFANRVLSEEDWDVQDKAFAAKRLLIIQEQNYEWL